MSQMKPYCFKCGAELDPEAIYCPECGRLQRSMVVRSVDPHAPSPPAPPPSGPSQEQQPYQFYPDREAPTPEPTAPPPDQHDPYARQDQEQDWRGGQQPDAYGEQTPYAEHGGDQVYAQQEYDQSWYREGDAGQAEPEPGYGRPEGGYRQGDAGYGQDDAGYGQHDAGYWQHDAGHGQQDAAYGQPDPGYGQPDPGYGQPDPGYGQPDPGYGQHDAGYGQHDAGYGQHDAGYGQHDAGYGQPDAGYEQPDAGYGQVPDPTYGQPAYGEHQPHPYSGPAPGPEGSEPPEQSWHGRPEPHQRSEPYTPPAPIYQQPAAPPPAPGPPRPADPVYSSSAPIPGGRLEPYSIPPPPSGGFGPPTPSGAGGYGQSRASNPYAPATYDADATYGRPGGRGPLRLIALGAAVLLGLFLIAFAVGQFLGSRGNSPAAATGQATSAPPTAATSSPPPTTAPTATPAPTDTPAQGITGTARFARVSSSIPGRCSTAQGCPIQVVLRNNGGSGSGTVTVTLTDDGGNPIATFSGAIPVTDAGATATVDGYATGDQLGTYLKNGGIVHITSVDVKSGG